MSHLIPPTHKNSFSDSDFNTQTPHHQCPQFPCDPHSPTSSLTLPNLPNISTMEVTTVTTAAHQRQPSPQPQPQQQPYILKATKYNNEDILFCIDVDSECLVEMKNTGPNGRPITRLDTIKQSILLFIHSKLMINPNHRFAFAQLGKTASWVRKEFISDVDAAVAALRGLSVIQSGGQADLSSLFRIAAHEAKKSRAQNRILRVILLYCRSSIQPQFQFQVAQKLFTLDVVYLHDKPGPNNCPQKVYDALVEALEHVTEFEGYIYETGQGLQRILFRHMCLLLSHPQQRCIQDDLGLPMSLMKKVPVTDSSQGDDTITVSSQ